MAGKTEQIKGRTKEAVGDLTGDKDLQAEGRMDRQAGRVKEEAGKVEDKVDEAIDKVKDVFRKK